MKTFQRFKIGDVVSRMGDDEQVIISVNDIGDMIEVKCIKPNTVFNKGDIEHNCADSYDFIRESNADLTGNQKPGKEVE
jgi:hypothetical protein